MEALDQPPRMWVVGSSILDLVFRTQRLPHAGESVIGESFNSFPGGKGANQAVALAKLGAEVSFIGIVGDDAAGRVLRTSVQDAGVNCAYLQTHPSLASGTAGVLIESSGQNRIIVAPGANMGLAPGDVAQALRQASNEFVLVQLEIPIDCVRAAVSTSSRVILNPAPARDLEENILQHVFVLTPNESEALHLSGYKPEDLNSCRRIAGLLLDMGVQNVVLTLGERGCYWRSAEGNAYVPAPKVKAVDTVGAGDAFNAGLGYFLNQGRDWRNALELANSVAALSVTKHGAQTSMPTMSELVAFAGHLL